MQDKKQYLIVGFFVLAGLVLVVGIWMWFSEGSRKSYDTYQIVFHEPVDGITTNSVVKYNGVEIGRVKDIKLNYQNLNDIYILVDIFQGVPITTKTYAILKPQGITGMSYIDLNIESQVDSTLIKPKNTPPYPQIQSKKSFISGLLEDAHDVTGNVKDISIQVRKLLNDKNIAHASNIVANLDKLISAMAQQSDQIKKTVGLVDNVLISFNGSTQKFNIALEQLVVLSKDLQSNSRKLDGVMDYFKNDTLRTVNTVFMPNLNRAMINLNQTTGQLDQLIRTVNQNPSALVRGELPPEPGPGE